MKVVLNLENDYVTIEIELFRTYNPMVTTHGDRATAIWEKWSKKHHLSLITYRKRKEEKNHNMWEWTPNLVEAVDFSSLICDEKLYCSPMAIKKQRKK